MPDRNDETYVDRGERELGALVKLYRRRPLVASLLSAGVIGYAVLELGHNVQRPTSEPTSIYNPAHIRNSLQESVKIAIADGPFSIVPVGGELLVPVTKAGTVVRLHSCGWNEPPCMERHYPLFGGQYCEVVFEAPYTRVGLVRQTPENPN